MDFRQIVRAWAVQRRDHAQLLLDEAEQAMEDSEFTDIDALEQKAANQAIVELLVELLELVR